MAIVLVTYDLKKPGQNYSAVFDYLKKFTHCKGMESVWLLDTITSCETIRESLRSVADSNDIIFVVRLQRDWSSLNYSCAAWLNDPARNW